VKGGTVRPWPAPIYGACLGSRTTFGLIVKQIGLDFKAKRALMAKQITSDFKANWPPFKAK